MQKFKAELSDEDWHDLAVVVDKARKNSETVKVSKRALNALLNDHGRLLRHVEGDLIR